MQNVQQKTAMAGAHSQFLIHAVPESCPRTFIAEKVVLEYAFLKTHPKTVPDTVPETLPEQFLKHAVPDRIPQFPEQLNRSMPPKHFLEQFPKQFLEQFRNNF